MRAIVWIYYKLKAPGVAVVCAQPVATVNNGLVRVSNGGNGVEEWRSGDRMETPNKKKK